MLIITIVFSRVWSKKYPICIRLLPLSRKGVRYRSSGQETVDETVPWLEEEKYSAETASVESDGEKCVTLLIIVFVFTAV